MQKPKLPDNEAERLHTLRSLNILDTKPEERFDNITLLTQRVFQVPIALVSIVDESRQWFKSCIGLPVNETDRDISFCGHTILNDTAFVIPNALEDERFSDNPLVVDDPKIRFYAGYPIKAPNGSALGTLCVIDRVSREFSDADIIMLGDFAALVEREISISYLASIDELTNISNRRGFMTLAQHELNRCKRDNTAAALIFFDLNKFKNINDTFGHAEGDKALIKFVATIQTVLRDSDIFGRIGGDEFVLLLSNTTELQAKNVLTRCQNLLDQYNLEIECDYTISFSHGMVSLNPDQYDSIENILLEADSLMYKDKDCQQ